MELNIDIDRDGSAYTWIEYIHIRQMDKKAGA